MTLGYNIRINLISTPKPIPAQMAFAIHLR